MDVHNLVFDFGAVLFAWQPQQILMRELPEHADSPARAAGLAQQLFHHPDWIAFDRGMLALEQVVERSASRLGLPQPQLQALLDAVPTHLAPLPDTVALLERLQARRARTGGLRLYYLSNMPAPYARQLERRHAFLRAFDGGVFSGDVQLAKPEPEIFRLLQARHGLEPARTLFIDDMPVNVEAARAQGWQAVRFESAAALAPALSAHLD